jgi:hypothetical protein
MNKVVIVLISLVTGLLGLVLAIDGIVEQARTGAFHWGWVVVGTLLIYISFRVSCWAIIKNWGFGKPKPKPSELTKNVASDKEIIRGITGNYISQEVVDSTQREVLLHEFKEKRK